VTGGAVLKAALAGAARRLTQTVVIFVVLAMATTAALVGLTLATNPTQAFQALSARYRTADLAVTIDAMKVTSAQLAATRRLPGVTKAVGYPATTVNVTIPATPGYREGVPVSGPLTVVGRASRSGPLDHITQKSGRWPTRLGEIDDNDLSGTRGSVGLLQTITVTGLRGKPKLAIVGWGSLAAQDDTQNAWALPGTITALERAGAPRQEQMLYTFRHASTVGQVSADLAELRAALPARTIIGHAVALSSENLATMGNGIHASSAVPYAVMALLLAAVIIAAGRAVINAPSPHQQLRGGQPTGGRTSGAQGIFAPAFTTAGQNPYTPGELALLALAGLVIALAGALGPAIWAAASRTTTALRAE